MRLVLASFAFAALCSFASAQTPEASQAQDLSNCAGAVASAGGFDVVHFAGADGDNGQALEAILARLSREPGLEGVTGRYAASAAKAHWDEQAAAERDQEAARCRTRYAGA